MNKLLVTSMFLAVTGCGSQPFTQITAVPEGSSLRLNTVLHISSQSAHADVQYGRPAESGGVNLNDPFCQFEVNDLAGSDGETIEPGTYTITTTHEYTRSGDSVMAKTGAGLRVAGLNLAQAMQIEVDYITELEIANNAPPNLQRVYCHNVAGADIGRFLTFEELNQALNPTAEIVAPSSN